jgi:ubiquitin carboxyl-terminal hydrolase 34
MLYQFMKMMSFLELSERQDYNPREFCFSYKDFDSMPTNVREQKDTQEFLNVVFDRLEFSIKATPQKYLLQNVFGGETCSVMICKGCGNVKQNTEPFFNLTLEVKNQKSIFDGLRRLTTGETIQDYTCDACNSRVEVERKMAVQTLPNTLFLHLQRIQMDLETFMNKKLNDRVEFPNTLNMRPYMKDEVLKQNQEAIANARRNQRARKLEEAKAKKQGSDAKNEDGKEGEDQVMNNENVEDVESEKEEQDQEMKQQLVDEDFEYKLVGVVLHMGTADAGHYLSYININRGDKNEESPEWLKTDKEKWLEFNDSTVKHYSFTNLEGDCFGGGNPNQMAGETGFDYSRNAYMLIYEKRRKTPLKFVIPEAFV